MDVRQVGYFLAVVDEGTVHGAAAALLVAQPSVSQAVRRLERELGTELFLRTGRRMVLTAAGRALVEPARDLVRARDAARASVVAAGGDLAGRLLVSAMPSQAVHPLPALVAAFRSHHQGVSVGVSTARSAEEVSAAVRTGTADVGLLAVASTPHHDPGLDVVPLLVQGFVLVAREGDRLPPGDGPVRPDELHDLDLVVGQRGTGMRRVSDAVPPGNGCRVAVQVEHREALLPLVRSGAGVAVVADSWRELAQAAGLVVRPVATPETLHVALVLPTRFVGPAAAGFVETARRQHRPGR